MRSKEKRLKHHKLFYDQGGKCHYCRNPMRLLTMPAKVRRMPPDLCTLEHLDDRFSPERGSHPFEKRIVAACWKCNNEQNIKRMQDPVVLELQRERSKRGRREKTERLLREEAAQDTSSGGDGAQGREKQSAECVLLSALLILAPRQYTRPIPYPKTLRPTLGGTRKKSESV